MGKQTGTDIWVLNREVQVNGIGNWIDLADSNFVWQPVGGPCIKTSMGKGSIALDLEAEIMLLLQSVSSLHQLLTTMQEVLKHNFIAGKLTCTCMDKSNHSYLCIFLSGVFLVAAGAMAKHYEALMAKYNACPLPLFFGESETGKSTAVRCALSICGQHNVGHLMKMKSTSATINIERSAMSTVPFALDDPKSTEKFRELLILIFTMGD